MKNVKTKTKKCERIRQTRLLVHEWLGVVLVALVLTFGVRVNAGCNSPSGKSVTVNITSHSDGDQVVVKGILSVDEADDNTAILQKSEKLTASSSGDDDSKLKWGLQGWSFAKGRDYGVLVYGVFDGWPAQTVFGHNKKITLTYEDGISGNEGDCNAEKKVTVYFPPLLAKTPGREKAWFKYWKDNAVGRAPCPLYYQTTISTGGYLGSADAFGKLTVSVGGGIIKWDNNDAGIITSAHLYLPLNIKLCDAVLDRKAGTIDDVIGMQECLNHEVGHYNHVTQWKISVNSTFSSLASAANLSITGKTKDEVSAMLQPYLDQAINAVDSNNDFVLDNDPDDGDPEGLAWKCTSIGVDTSKDWSEGGAQW